MVHYVLEDIIRRTQRGYRDESKAAYRDVLYELTEVKCLYGFFSSML